MKNQLGLIFLFVFTLFSIQSYSSTDKKGFDSYYGKGNFVVKGKVSNKSDKFKTWKLAVTGYVDNESYDIEVAEDGTFYTEIPIVDVQNIYLYLGDAITIFSYPGDTIEINFDAKDKINSLQFLSNNNTRQKELDLCLLIYNKFRTPYLDLNKLSYTVASSEELLLKANEYYDAKIELIDAFSKEHGDLTFINKFRDETYYQAARVMTRFITSLDKVHCKHPKGETVRIKGTERDTILTPSYNVMNVDVFRTTEEYRSFLNFYLNRSHIKFEVSGKRINTPVKDRYYFTLSCVKSEIVRDWCMVNILNDAFTYDAFSETALVYDEFKKICKNADYLELIEQKYKRALAIQPGNVAPDFELKDENGKLVRLSDFKGKIIYIDFWAIWCGPCISEFKNAKDKFIEKYKDYDIVHLYICVDGSEKEWKKAIEKYNLTGVNLIAEGWSKNPVCQSYNVQGVPHYTLIGKDGEIAITKCDRPSIILAKGEKSDFDKFVKASK